MGVTLPRRKPRNILLSVMYRLGKLPFASDRTKFKIYLNLEWIFDRLAHEMSYRMYSSADHPFRVQSREFLLELLSPEHTVLDLGCHEGDLTVFLAETAKAVVGIDHNKDVINRARLRHQRRNLEFHHGEARAFLEDHDKRYDVLVLSGVLEHLDEPRQFLARFKDRFAFIYIEVPDFDRYLLNHYRQHQGVDLIYSDADHVSEFDRFELRELLTSCGLEILKEMYIHGVQKIWCRVTSLPEAENDPRRC